MAAISLVGAQPQALAQAVQEKKGQPDTSVGAQGTAPAEATAEPQADQLSPKYAALAKRERMLREKAREIEAREKKFEDYEKERNSSYVPKDRIKTNPMEVLLENGVSYEQLTNAILNQGAAADPVLIKLQQELKEIKEAQNQTSTKFEEAQKQQYDQAVSQISREVKLLVDGDARFETIKAMSAHEAVVELIKATFDSDGYLMSEEEAAQAVEDHLLDEAMKMASLQKVKAKLFPQPEAEPEAPKAQSRQQTHSIQTLSNATTQSSSSRPKSERDRRDRAVKAFLGQLE